MTRDLQRLEVFLGEIFSYIKKKDELSGLREIFQSKIPLPIFDFPPQYFKLAKSLLPPEGQTGTLDDILKHWSQFSVCLYYDRMDVFWQQRLEDSLSAKKEDAHAMWSKVENLKQGPLEEEGLAQRILAGHVLYDLMPQNKSEKEKAFRITADIGRGSGTPVEETQKFFNEQKAGADFAIVTNVPPNGWAYMPEDSLSSFLAYLRVNAKLHLVASNFTGQSFFDDGDFFKGANLRFSNLTRTQWDRSSCIDGMCLEGAILRNTHHLTEDMLAKTYIDNSTILPKGFSRDRILEKHAALGMPPAPPFTEFEWQHANDQRVRILERRHSNSPAPSA